MKAEEIYYPGVVECADCVALFPAYAGHYYVKPSSVSLREARQRMCRLIGLSGSIRWKSWSAQRRLVQGQPGGALGRRLGIPNGLAQL